MLVYFRDSCFYCYSILPKSLCKTYVNRVLRKNQVCRALVFSGETPGQTQFSFSLFLLKATIYWCSFTSTSPRVNNCWRWSQRRWVSIATCTCTFTLRFAVPKTFINRNVGEIDNVCVSEDGSFQNCQCCTSELNSHKCKIYTMLQATRFH